MIKRAILAVTVAMVAISAQADTKTLVGLRLSCTGGNIMPRPRLCRMAGVGGRTTALWPCGVRHNQSASRKASSLSSGRYRPGFISGAVTRDRAFSFIRRSAWM